MQRITAQEVPTFLRHPSSIFKVPGGEAVLPSLTVKRSIARPELKVNILLKDTSTRVFRHNTGPTRTRSLTEDPPP